MMAQENRTFASRSRDALQSSRVPYSEDLTIVRSSAPDVAAPDDDDIGEHSPVRWFVTKSAVLKDSWSVEIPTRTTSPPGLLRLVSALFTAADSRANATHAGPS